MGSSHKKKHKKHKDKDRERSRSKCKLSADFDASASWSADSNLAAANGTPSEASAPPPKAPAIRLVLKVPPSAYSQANLAASSSPDSVVTQDDISVASGDLYSNNSTAAPPPPTDPTSQNLENVPAPPTSHLVSPSHSNSTSTSKKAHKKSKKSKKSKHHKHHKHSSHRSKHHHHHRHHHHHSSSTSTTDGGGQQLNLFTPSTSSTLPTDWLTSALDSTSSYHHQTLSTHSDLFPPPITDPFGEPSMFSGSSTPFAPSTLPSFSATIPPYPIPAISADHEDDQNDWSINTDVESVINSLANGSTTSAPSVVIEPPSPPPSYYQTTSSSHPHQSEIKLKLSKTTSAAGAEQYSSQDLSSPRPPPLPPAPVVSTSPVPPPTAPTLASPSKPSMSMFSPIPDSPPPAPRIFESSLSLPSSNVKPTTPPPPPQLTIPSISINTTNMSISPSKGPRHVVPPTPSPNDTGSGTKRPKSVRNLQSLLSHCLRQLVKRDSKHFFALPVSDSIAPGYSSIISHPMDLSTIRTKITSGHYLNLGDFKADVKLMCDNAMKYNRPETIYYKTANKLWHYTKNKLFKKDALAEYAKTYFRCTPLELSLNPTQPPPGSSKGISSANHPLNGSSTTFYGDASTIASAAFPMLPSLVENLRSEPSPFSGSGTSSSTNSLATSSMMPFEPNGGTAAATATVFGGGVTPFKAPPVNFESGDYLKPPSSGSFFNQPAPPLPLPPATAKKRGEIVCDGMTAEELVASIKASAAKAAERLRTSRKRPPAYSCLQQEADGSIVLQTLNTGDIPASSRRVSIEDVYRPSNAAGRIAVNLLADNLGELLPVNGGGETSKEETTQSMNGSSASSGSSEPTPQLRQHLLGTYGDDLSLDYALSIAKFGRGCEYSENLVNSLMGVLTAYHHRHVHEQFYQLVDQQLTDG